jgi:hypothetical protein
MVPFDGGPVPAGLCRNCGEPIVAEGAKMRTPGGVVEDFRWSHAVGGDRCRITFAQPKVWTAAVAEAAERLSARDTSQDATLVASLSTPPSTPEETP